MSGLAIRHRLLLVVVLAVTAALAALIVGFNLLLAHNLASDADRLARPRAAAELGVLDIRNGRVVVTETPDDLAPDASVWVFSHGRMIESPPASAQVTAAARRLALKAPAFMDVAETSTRLYATPIDSSGRRYGAVVAGVSKKPYEQTQRTALLASLGLGGAVLLLVVAAAWWLLTSSLRPVARMTRLASEWSDRDLDRRFGVEGPGDELTALAATLDGLLDRLAASLRREQRFSAELSHELRTPLSRLLAETELALRRPRPPEEYREALERVRRDAQQLARTIDALVTAARYESGGQRGTSDAFAVATAVSEGGTDPAAERRVSVDIRPPMRPIRLGVDGELAERVLQPVVDNARRYGRTVVHVTIARQSSEVVYSISDDGPGIAPEEREHIFEPGGRGLAGRANGTGAGLGLALARRLARSAAGDVTAGSAGSGATFVVRLPAA
jgi:two-component system, OmpR family, sensor kinase